MRISIGFAASLALIGCAAAPKKQVADEPPAAAAGGPEIVHTGKTLNVDFNAAQTRYAAGARCGGSDAPETIIGAPDQRNETQVGRDRVVVYGFRFPQATLLIRCRNDRVESAKTLR
jgi:hypothetical protein